MNEPADIDPRNIDRLYRLLSKNAEASGYHLNPDKDFTKDLVRSLLINESRYGYQACPCRLSAGVKSEDLDIICPCDYRDQDLDDYGTCYCGLYISQDVIEGNKQIQTIPERRPVKEKRTRTESAKRRKHTFFLPFPIWRCRVCGYLCAREKPPETCPVCKAPKERFEQFM